MRRGFSNGFRPYRHYTKSHISNTLCPSIRHSVGRWDSGFVNGYYKYLDCRGSTNYIGKLVKTCHSARRVFRGWFRTNFFPNECNVQYLAVMIIRASHTIAARRDPIPAYGFGRSVASRSGESQTACCLIRQFDALTLGFNSLGRHKGIQSFRVTQHWVV